jgi:hypothetical protein
METKTDRPKKEFWRYGAEIGETDVMIFNDCKYDTCSLCDQERRGRCEQIRNIVDPPEHDF